MAGQSRSFASPSASGCGGPFILTITVALLLSPGSLAVTDCSDVTTPLLTGCQSFIASPTATPDRTKCCDPLKSVLADSDKTACLCSLQSGAGASVSPEITQRALGLPKACNITTTFSAASCTNSTSTGANDNKSSSSQLVFALSTSIAFLFGSALLALA